jgi:hypothetical protein
LLLDCAEICQTAANFMLRNSELHSRTCAVCARSLRPLRRRLRTFGRWRRHDAALRSNLPPLRRSLPEDGATQRPTT